MLADTFALQQDPFCALFQGELEKEGDEFVKKARGKAWDHFLALGLPGDRHEAFTYMPLHSFLKKRFDKASREAIAKEAIAKEAIAHAVLPECQKSHLVFVNGYFHPELSDTTAVEKAVIVTPFKQAMKNYSTLIQNRAAKALKEEADVFSALNMACFQDGVFLYIPPKLKVCHPIQILHVITEMGSWMMPRIYLFQGSHSELTCAQTFCWQCRGDVGKYFYNALTELTLEEGAQTTLIQQALSHGGEAPCGWIFDSVRAEVKRSCCLRSFQLTDGTATVRRDSAVKILGEGADVQLNGIFLLNDDKEAHVNVIVDHEAPHATSFQLFKSVLTDASKSSFQGKILVRKPAQKTEAYQLNNNLLLSDTAQANSKPNLEIFADDVKASHGATVGQLDPEELFYLKARGFHESAAKRALITGFCQEVTDKIPVASIREHAEERICTYGYITNPKRSNAPSAATEKYSVKEL